MRLLRRGATAPAIKVRKGCGDCAAVAAPHDKFCRRCGMVMIDCQVGVRPALAGDGDYGEVVGLFAFYGPPPVHGRI